MKYYYNILISQDPKKPNKQGTVAEVTEYNLAIERNEQSDICSVTIEPTIPPQWLPNGSQFTVVAENDDDIISDAIRRLTDRYPYSEFLYSCQKTPIPRL
jgi:hypothetical protein